MANQEAKLDNTDVKLNKSILSLVEQYATCDARSAELNDERATIRENVEKLGIPSVAFQRFVADQKKMSPGEFRDMQAGYQRMQEAAEAEGVDIQGQFWPDLKKAAEKRAERKAAAEAEANKGKAGAPDPDKNPRSDPAKGGAKPRVGKKGETGNVVTMRPSEEQLTESAAAASQEQQEGDAVLNGLTPETQAAQNAALNPDGKPKSQSQIAAEKMEAAKLSGAKLN